MSNVGVEAVTGVATGSCQFFPRSCQVLSDKVECLSGNLVEYVDLGWNQLLDTSLVEVASEGLQVVRKGKSASTRRSGITLV